MSSEDMGMRMSEDIELMRDDKKSMMDGVRILGLAMSKITNACPSMMP